ncbi:MAG: hypothetical protein GX996_09030 [Firmicutes bacterium]|nr:hypothetical protein [Bacillota bacterium]
MKTTEKNCLEIERLFMDYEKEVKNLEAMGILGKLTATTYLTHAWNFVRWCRGTFEPEARNRRQKNDCPKRYV